MPPPALLPLHAQLDSGAARPSRHPNPLAPASTPARRSAMMGAMNFCPELWTRTPAFFAAVDAAASGVPSLARRLWDTFNDVIAFTANVWQNIDGLVFLAVAVYLFIRLAKSVLGRDESTIKTSTSFDYLGAFPRESDHKVYLLEEVWKLPFQEKTVRACYEPATDEQPYLCVPNRAVWLALHNFYSGIRNDAVPRASNLRRDYTLRRVSHILGITFGNYEIKQARIEDLAAPKLVDILRDPVKEFRKAALSSRDLETARQLALIELAALVCWKAPHLLTDALMEPELNRESLLRAPGASPSRKSSTSKPPCSNARRTSSTALPRRGATSASSSCSTVKPRMTGSIPCPAPMARAPPPFLRSRPKRSPPSNASCASGRPFSPGPIASWKRSAVSPMSRNVSPITSMCSASDAWRPTAGSCAFTSTTKPGRTEPCRRIGERGRPRPPLSAPRRKHQFSEIAH